MRRNILINFILVMIGIAFCACGKKEDDNAQKAAEQEQIPSVVATASPTPVPEEETETVSEDIAEKEAGVSDYVIENSFLPDDGIADGRMLISIGGRPIYAGCSLSDLVEAGFSVKEKDMERDVAPGEKLRVDIVYESDDHKKENMVYVLNMTDEETEAENCMVTGITMTEGNYYFGTGDRIDHGFVPWETTSAQLREVYGEPDGFIDDSPFDYVMYGTPANYVSFTIGSDDDVIALRTGYYPDYFGDECNSLLENNKDGDWNVIYAAAAVKGYTGTDTDIYLNGEGPSDGFYYDGSFTIEDTALHMGDAYGAIPEERQKESEMINPYTDALFKYAGLSLKLRNATSSFMFLYECKIMRIISSAGEDPCPMSVMGISQGASIEDIISKLGKPTELAGDYMYHEAELIYRVSGYKIYYLVDAVTDEVIQIEVEIEED